MRVMQKHFESEFSMRPDDNSACINALSHKQVYLRSLLGTLEDQSHSSPNTTYSSGSNGITESSVNTSKEDYMYVKRIQNTEAKLDALVTELKFSICSISKLQTSTQNTRKLPCPYFKIIAERVNSYSI